MASSESAIVRRMFDVRAVRADLPSTTASVFLNAGSFGPVPRVAADAMRAHVDRSLEHGRIGNAGFARMIAQLDRARAAFAGAIGADAEDVALAHCTTDGLDQIVWGLSLAAGDEVLTTTHEHPGLTAPLEELTRVRGVTVRAVDPADVATSLGPRTKLVAVSHVLWTTGETLDVAAIARAAKGSGAFVLVDGAQSVGAIDVNPAALGVDAYTVSGQKWLCGPSGTGALWVRRSALSQIGTPWPWYLSKSRGPAGVSDWPGARRLDATTCSMTSLERAIAALGWHARWAREGALAEAARRAEAMRRELRALPNVRLTEVARPSTLIAFAVEGEPANAVVARLEAKGVLVRSIPDTGAVRVSVGFWNDDRDLERLLHELRR